MGGNLSANSGNGDITQAGALTVAGTTGLTSGTGGITLNNAANNFGSTVDASGANVALTDANALTLGTVTATGGLTLNSTGALSLGTSTVGGNLSANSGNGDITQAGPLKVRGASSFVAGTGSVNLMDPGNVLELGTTVQAARSLISGDLLAASNSVQGAVMSATPAISMPGSAVAGTTPPQPLVTTSALASVVSMPAATAGAASAAASSSASSAETQTVSGAGNTNGVTVDLRKPPAAETAVMAAVSLPRGLATSGAGFGFSLPDSVRALASEGSTAQASLPNGAPLPVWLKFDAATMRFEASAVPDGAFPIQVQVALGAQRVLVVISERTE